MGRDRHLRTRDLIDQDRLGQCVNIVGVGGIGSPTAFLLVKMGWTHLHLWDPQSVEVENLGTQMFREKDLGRPKVKAVLSRIMDEHPSDHLDIDAYPEKFDGVDESSVVDGPLLLLADGYQEKTRIWRNLRKRRDKPQLVIDARMGAEVCHIYSWDPRNAHLSAVYSESLKGEEQQLPCTAKATIYCGTGAAVFIVRTLKRWVHAQDYPFSWVFDFVRGEAHTLEV